VCSAFIGLLSLFLVSLALGTGEARAQSVLKVAAVFAHHLDGIDCLANLELGRRLASCSTGRPPMRCG